SPASERRRRGGCQVGPSSAGSCPRWSSRTGAARPCPTTPAPRRRPPASAADFDIIFAVAFLDDAGNQALTRAIAAVEARSRAEVVVVVRPIAGSYLGEDLLVANLVGFAALG